MGTEIETSEDIVLDVPENFHGKVCVCREVLSKVIDCQNGIC